MSATPRLLIGEGKGFQLTFANGWTASVMFGPGNYCVRQRSSYEEIPGSGGSWISADAECLAFAPDGTPGQPDGWRSPDEVAAFLSDVAAR